MPPFMVLFLLFCSLPDVTLPPPRMVLVGALAQVLLVPPSGYRCFRRRPGCLASVRGVFVAHCLPSSLCLMATKAFGPVWGSFPLHHASCVVGVLCAPSLRYSSSYDPWPLFGLRFGTFVPLLVRVCPFSFCPLLPPGSSPRFLCVACGVVCVVLWPLPPFCFPP